MRLDEENDDAPERSKPEEQVFMGVAKALYASRTVLIFGEVEAKMAERTTAHLLALASEGTGDIRVFVNSPGGEVDPGNSICDMIRFIGPRVKMVATGMVASMGTMIFLSAQKENRFCLPATRFMLHQPIGGVGGRASDIEIGAKEIIKMREHINRRICEATGQPMERVAKDTDRDFWLGPEEAMDYGMVNRVIRSAAELDSA